MYTKYCSATFHKGYKQFIGIHVYGGKAVLQDPKSDVRLCIPEGNYGFILGHSHTNPTPFLDHIPKSECLVSRIVQYNCLFARCSERLFKIKVPHCVRNSMQFQQIRVRHGDIYKKLPFYDKCTFTVDEQFITI